MPQTLLEAIRAAGLAKLAMKQQELKVAKAIREGRRIEEDHDIDDVTRAYAKVREQFTSLFLPCVAIANTFARCSSGWTSSPRRSRSGKLTGPLARSCTLTRSARMRRSSRSSTR